ncbi:MAG TPA: C40 family peptidase [Actinomycetales bacterium]|nr:C40 family peptidase [Actinomycetales bacterium]
MPTRSAGRHRAPSRATLPQQSRQALAHVTGNAGAVAKTSAVIAVSGGLVASLGMQANAAPPQAPSRGPASASTAASDVPAALVQAPLGHGPVAAPQYGEIGFTAQAAAKPKVTAPRVTDRVSRSTTRRALSVTAPAALSAPAPVKAGAPGSPEFGATVLAIAARYAGTPYVYGGTTPSGFDCSGYTAYVFAQVGIDLPRTSSAQRAATRRISRSDAMPGDLVFLPGHVGIYAGGGMMWDAPRTGKDVQKRPIYSSSATFGRVG